MFHSPRICDMQGYCYLGQQNIQWNQTFPNTSLYQQKVLSNGMARVITDSKAEWYISRHDDNLFVMWNNLFSIIIWMANALSNINIICSPYVKTNDIPTLSKRRSMCTAPWGNVSMSRSKCQADVLQGNVFNSQRHSVDPTWITTSNPQIPSTIT